jgi:hypothetical protein
MTRSFAHGDEAGAAHFAEHGWLLTDTLDAHALIALRAWVEAIGPRVDAMTRQIEEYPLTLEGRESFHVGSALWADARKAAKKKQWDRAFRLLMDALVEMDRVVYEAYPTSR